MADDELKIIRQVRHEISAEFGHDVDRVWTITKVLRKD